MDTASVSRGVPVYCPAFAGTHCAYPWGSVDMGGWFAQRWLTCPKMVTYPGTNRARRTVAMLIETIRSKRSPISILPAPAPHFTHLLPWLADDELPVAGHRFGADLCSKSWSFCEI